MKRCKHVEKNGLHYCGSYAFNLDIEQGNLCDVHYWQKQALNARADDDDDTMCYRSELEVAVKAEREACAKICDKLHSGLSTKRAAELIRERGNT